jgi:hypothetical protein
MTRQCSHNHGGSDHGHAHAPSAHSHAGITRQMNLWTRLNQVGEFVEGVNSVTYFSIGSTSLLLRIIYWANDAIPEPDSDEYIYTTLAVSLAVANIVGLGAAYCHGILNMQHQTAPAPHTIVVTPTAEPSVVKRDSLITSLTKSISKQYQTFSDEDKSIELTDSTRKQLAANKTEIKVDSPKAKRVVLEVDNHHGHGHHHAHSHAEHNHVHLTHLQKFWVALDAISHGAGRAGSIMGGVEANAILVSAAGTSVPVQLGTALGAILFGTVTSVAEVNTCKESLRRYNKSLHAADTNVSSLPDASLEETKQMKMNLWTRINQVGEFTEGVDSVTYFSLGNLNLLFKLIAWIYATPPEPDSDTYTYTSLTIALLVACLVGIGAAYCHGILNMQHQDDAPLPESSADEVLETATMLSDASSSDADDDDVIEIDTSTQTKVPNHSGKLSNSQKFWIALDAISHGTGRAGSIMGCIEATSQFVTTSGTPIPVQISTAIAATLFGVATSVAEVNTCTESLRRYNRWGG